MTAQLNESNMEVHGLNEALTVAEEMLKKKVGLMLQPYPIEFHD